MRFRLPAALTTALVLVTTLGGCFLLPTEQQQPSRTIAAEEPEGDSEESPSAAPEVGDCWTTLDLNWGTWVSWRGDPAVDCDEKHESYTFAVPTAYDEFDAIYLSNGFITDEAASRGYDICYGALAKFMHGHLEEWSLLEAQYFAPSKSEWADGARWVRCDLIMLELGSSIFEREVAELPDDARELVEAYADDSDSFNICIDTDDGFTGYGPYYSESAVYSDCTDDPMWRLDSVDYYPADYGTPYPGDDAMAQYVTDGCLAEMSPTQWGYAHFPDSTTWPSGDRSVTCWSYEWEVPEGTDPPV